MNTTLATQNLTIATPSEIDAEIARLKDEQGRALSHLYRIHEVEVVDEEKVSRVNIRLGELSDALNLLIAEYLRRGGWTRYYLVDGGHLHNDNAAWRCNRTATTLHYWMTDLSGMSPEEIVAVAGSKACTVCFPGAPVDRRPDPRLMTPTEAERAAHAELEIRKRAAKKAAELRGPDGKPVHVARFNTKTQEMGDGDHLRTERAAWNRALESAYWLAYDASFTANDPENLSVETREYRATIDRVVTVLVPLRDTSADALRAELTKKTRTKARREGWDDQLSTDWAV